VSKGSLTSDEFFGILQRLIDDWCDRRFLGPLAEVLPAYCAFVGLTDSWTELHKALKWASIKFKHELLAEEGETLATLVISADQIARRF
jgi:hypothetical protein